MSTKAIKHILVYVTTRNNEHAALRRAANLARHTGAKLTLLAVAEELSLLLQRTVNGPNDLVESLKAETGEHLQQLAQPLIDEGLPVRTEVRYGKPHIEVIRAVRELKIDLVLKTAASDTLRPVFGSTAMKLLRLCPAPVWVEKTSRRKALKRVVAAVDPFCEDEAGNQLNRKIIEIALTVAAVDGAELTVLHAWQAFGESILKGRGGLPARDVALYRKNARTKAREAFDAMLDGLDVTVKKSQTRLIEGEAERVIPDYTRQNRSDLIVMGTVARTGIAGMLIGNTAEQILSRVGCSVLAIKPEGFKSPVRAR